MEVVPNVPSIEEEEGACYSVMAPEKKLLACS
jgi:hypothetical protein